MGQAIPNNKKNFLSAGPETRRKQSVCSMLNLDTMDLSAFVFRLDFFAGASTLGKSTDILIPFNSGRKFGLNQIQTSDGVDNQHKYCRIDFRF